MKVKVNMNDRNENVFQMSILKIEVIRSMMMLMCILGGKGHAFGMLIGQNVIDLAVFNYKIRKRGYYIFLSYSLYSDTCIPPPSHTP